MGHSSGNRWQGLQFVMHSVRQLLQDDKNSVAEIATRIGPAVIRFRTPVLGGEEMPGYERLLAILWPYADSGHGELPGSEVLEAMNAFEQAACEVLEQGAQAVLVAVLTFDGARQWVFYTGDVDQCRSRLATLGDRETWPLTLMERDDPTWRYLREQILARVDFDS